MLCNGRGDAAIFAADGESSSPSMQRFERDRRHLREPGQFGNIFTRCRIRAATGRASGGNQFDAEGGEFVGEIYQSGFVGDAKNGTLNFRHEGLCCG